MQTDARFIEDIKHSSQAGPDLSGEPDPLRFAATEGAALAIEREIAQPDLEQELQTRFNFTHHFRRDLLLLGRKRDLGNKLRRRFDRQLRKLMDIEFASVIPSNTASPARTEGSRCVTLKLTSAGSLDFARDNGALHRHRQNLRSQSRATANLAWLAGHERTNPITGEFAFGFLVEPLHLWHQTLKRLGDLFTVTAELNFNRCLARSKIKRALKIFWQLSKRRFFVDAKMFYQRALQFFVIGLHPLRSATPWRNHSLRDRFFRLGDHQLRINHQLRPQSVTRRTGTEMTVKGKMFRR